MILIIFFFFQAEDGIRDLTVTGVQTCALPISLEAGELVQDIHRQVGEVVEQMRRGQVNVGGVEELSAAALEALDAIVAATAEATSHAQRIAAAAGDQDKAFGKLRQRIHAVAAIAGKNRAA